MISKLNLKTTPSTILSSFLPSVIAGCLVLATGLMGTVTATAATASSNASAQNSRYSNKAEFASYAEKLRESALLKMEPRVQVRTSGRTVQLPSTSTSSRRHAGRHPWKTNIVTTVFWVGERPTARNPTPNHASSWDPKWASNYGGYDNPDTGARRGYIPAGFVPRQNPFYIALPYNDVTRGTTKPEARFVIPWFKDAFERPGKSVCRSRWIAVRHRGRVAYAQWEDCGPFRTDHWQYVFGNERPKANLNQGAGLDVSPAVRDFLGMANKDVCDWKFVEFSEVPFGPWSRYGDNNTFVQKARGLQERVATKKGTR